MLLAGAETWSQVADRLSASLPVLSPRPAVLPAAGNTSSSLQSAAAVPAARADASSAGVGLGTDVDPASEVAGSARSSDEQTAGQLRVAQSTHLTGGGVGHSSAVSTALPPNSAAGYCWWRVKAWLKYWCCSAACLRDHCSPTSLPGSGNAAYVRVRARVRVLVYSSMAEYCLQ
jgi:hypothetical protein